jgi:hypothetical protein
MSKSEQTIVKAGAAASRSKSAQKVLDIERRFIDDFIAARCDDRIVIVYQVRTPGRLKNFVKKKARTYELATQTLNLGRATTPSRY